MSAGPAAGADRLAAVIAAEEISAEHDAWFRRTASAEQVTARDEEMAAYAQVLASEAAATDQAVGDAAHYEWWGAFWTWPATTDDGAAVADGAW